MTLLDMENKESILAALNDLVPDDKPPAILDEYLREIAKHGLTFIPWIHIKPLILLKFNHIMDEFIDDVDENLHQNVLRSTDVNDLRERVYKILSQFEGTPFTIQRICELLSDPRKHYSRPDKFLRGFEKVCLVVSTVDAYGNKIHNVEPRLSGTIERCTSFVLNGTSGEIGPNEDSPGGSKRSEDGEEEDNEDLTSPRRPCINFYRRPTSKLVEGLHKSFGGDSLIGAYSPGIPGKHTLQRPFLSGRGSSAIPFSTIFEDAEISCAAATTEDDDGGNNDDDRGEGELKQEKSESDGPISEEAKAPSASESTQQQRPLTGLQKLFLENEEDDRDMLISPVPSIEQMLRPMGQLEAFVNTISMVTANPTSSISHSATGISESSLPKEPPPSPSSEEDEATSESEVKEVEIPITEIKPPKNEESECKEEQRRDAEEGETSLNIETEKDTAKISPSSSVIRQASLKRRDSDIPSEDNVVVSLSSPAKRIRLDTEQEFTDIGFSESTLTPMDYGENENPQGISTEQYVSREENLTETEFSNDYIQSSTSSKEERKRDQEAETFSTTSLEPRDEQERPYATVDSDTGEKELLK